MTHLTSTINMIGFCLASIIVREEKTSLFQGYRRMFVGCVRRVRGWLWFPMQVRPSNCNFAPRQRFSWYVSYIMHQKQIWFTFFYSVMCNFAGKVEEVCTHMGVVCQYFWPISAILPINEYLRKAAQEIRHKVIFSLLLWCYFCLL